MQAAVVGPARLKGGKIVADKASTERRVAPRATFDTPVTVIVDGRETTWVGRDISETGMGLAPTAHGMAARGQAVRVCFALPRRHQGVCGTRLVRWFEAEARVVRRGPPGLAFPRSSSLDAGASLRATARIDVSGSQAGADRRSSHWGSTAAKIIGDFAGIGIA
jgi:hypothetical protein